MRKIQEDPVERRARARELRKAQNRLHGAMNKVGPNDRRLLQQVSRDIGRTLHGQGRMFDIHAP